MTRNQYMQIVVGVFALIGATILASFVLRIAPQHPYLSLFIERRFPGIIPSTGYAQVLYSPDKELVLRGFYYLAKRKDPIAVPRALELLNSKDDYVWLSAAEYLGACKRQEAVPYLIKALRHTAWHADRKTIESLHSITGLEFAADFTRWQQWWLSLHPDIQFDWTSHLGPRPRLSENSFDEAVKAF
jgi:HEAT repeats